MNRVDENTIDLKEIFKALKKRWKLIINVTLIITIVSALVSFFVIKPKYEASVKLFIGKDQSSSEEAAYNNSDVLMYQSLLKTYGEIIKTKDIAKKAISETGYDLKPSEVLEKISIETIANTQIIKIKYTSRDPEECVNMLNSIKKNFITLAEELVVNGNIQVLAEPRFPVSPSSPNKPLNIAVGLILGLMVSIGIVLLMEFLDNTYKDKNSFENEFDIPVLGVIPNMKKVS